MNDCVNVVASALTYLPFYVPTILAVYLLMRYIAAWQLARHGECTVILGAVSCGMGYSTMELFVVKRKNDINEGDHVLWFALSCVWPIVVLCIFFVAIVWFLIVPCAMGIEAAARRIETLARNRAMAMEAHAKALELGK